MVDKDICSHADLQALQRICSNADLQAQQGIHPDDDPVFARIVSLESVRIAHESYRLLRELVDQGSCRNSQLDLLSLVACVSQELHRVEHDLLPPLQDQEAKLEEGRVVQSLLRMKNSGLALSRLGKHLQEQLCESSDEEEIDGGVVAGRGAKDVGIILRDVAGEVLKGRYNFAWLKERWVPHIVEMVSALMATPVRFP